MNSQDDETTDPAELAAFTAEAHDLNLSGTSDPLASGQAFGEYRLVRRLGAGGFADVWEAESKNTGRRVALKVLAKRHILSPELSERFRREGRLAASINHPRCVFVFGAELINGYPAIAMELMRGGSLQDRLNAGLTFEPQKAVDITLEIIEGLEASSRAGILHRDVKPANCFVDETGRCKIGDFGISKSLENSADLTMTGTFVGTPLYASPEQIRGRTLDLRSDIYSVGATLYALLQGKPPFEGQNAVEVLARILTEAAPPLPKNVPSGLQRAILRAMSKNSGTRFQTYEDLRTALLPFSSRSLTTGRLLHRAIAYSIDSLCVNELMRLVFFLLSISREDHSRLFDGALTLTLFVYFSFTESRWGCSLGKYLLGLRVTTAEGAHPSLGQTVNRAAVFQIINLASQTVRAAPTWRSPHLNAGCVINVGNGSPPQRLCGRTRNPHGNQGDEA